MLDLIHDDSAYNRTVFISRTYGDDRESYLGTIMHRIGDRVWMRDDKYGHTVALISSIKVEEFSTPEEETIDHMYEYLDDCVIESGEALEFIDKVKQGNIPNLRWTGGM